MTMPQASDLPKPPIDRTHSLQQLMQRVGFSTFKALSQASGLSEKQLRQVRRGSLTHLRLDTLLKLSRALQIELPDLLMEMGEETEDRLRRECSAERSQESGEADRGTSNRGRMTVDSTALQEEYDRLQTRLVEQRATLLQEFQQSSLQILESLLLQLPTAAYAAQQNPQAPAIKLLPLLKPFDRLLQEWGIETIGSVGVEVAFAPHYHQLMDGLAEPGDPVRVRYVGYRQGDRLLYRAKVSPLR